MRGSMLSLEIKMRLMFRLYLKKKGLSALFNG